ncbi:MAG: response regulator transcription factor [Bacteroidales bacterium]|jgi:DNA-binding NarL/FixJ family response regulator
MQISVGIVEDHAAFRQSLVFLISSFSEYKVEWAFASAEEALKNPTVTDVLLLDINLPNLSGIDAIPLFNERFPGQKIMMLTIQEDEDSILKAIRNGADGYILKKTSPPKILEAIQQVYEGGAALTPMVAKQILKLFKPVKVTGDTQFDLTPRENEILNLIVQGIANSAIADKLFISLQTVRNHIKKIYEKLQVHSKAQAVAKVLKNKIG